MTWIKENPVIFFLVVIIVLSSLSGVTGVKYFKDENEKLEESIKNKQLRIDSIDALIDLKLEEVENSKEREKKLRDSLKMSQNERDEIKRRYNVLYNRIHTSTDSEYIEYLRSRISDTNRY